MTDTSAPRAPRATGTATTASNPTTGPAAGVSNRATASFDPVLDRLIAPEAGRLAAQLRVVPDLGADEQAVILAAATRAWRNSVRPKVTRTLVLEVYAARAGGRLAGPDPRSRWEHWLELATTDGFWPSIDDRYPTLRPRLDRVRAGGRRAAATFAHRFAADRSALHAVLPSGDPTLLDLDFGSGDTHRGGQTVAMVRCAAGPVVYKPRPLHVDAELAGLIARLLPDEPPATRIRVPTVVVRDGYGWAAHEAHRYCGTEEELHAFYRGLGHWAAVMRMLGGSDLHAENLIAVGPVPVIVDCETLFTPQPPLLPSGYGLASDRAGRALSSSVLGTGLLPGRGVALAWRGLDPSGAGGLRGEQPTVRVPVLVDEGTDQVRVGFAELDAPEAANQPSPEPVLARYWGDVCDAFDELTDRLRSLDRRGRLEPLLAGFTGCEVRYVRRNTETYAELARMLWHPASLFDEPAARARATDLLARHARNDAEAPDDPDVIAAEVADLLVGDIPMFTSAADPDLIAGTLRRWRGADPELDGQVLRSTLISAYLNEAPPAPAGPPLIPRQVRAEGLDRRRRALAAEVVRTLLATAVRAQDGTATWIAPVLTAGSGWAVQPLTPDMYLGTVGIAVLLAAYDNEVRAGRADPVDGAAELLDAVLATMRADEDRAEADRGSGIPIRPEPSGGYLGLGARIWGWLLLRRLGRGDAGLAGAGRSGAGEHGTSDEALRRAQALAALLPAAVRADEAYDLLRGPAGAIVPLLRLAEIDGDPRWPATAAAIGEHLRTAARRADGDPAAVWWPGPFATDGLGGVSHGATGIGWALSHLAGCGDLAAAAFRYEESLYDPGLPGWLDMRKPERPTDAAAWCHGAVGIGIVAADRWRRAPDPGTRERWADMLRRAAAASWPAGMGANHTLCHGELGTWELLRVAIDAGVAPSDVGRAELDARVLTGMEEFGAVAGPNRDAFRPGLLLGLGGIGYQLLRMHPGCRLPSVLLPDPGPPDRIWPTDG
ncbi:type 2 lanthipeptide synthetase LanM family protein [Polymorphospora lycopeni]|uniref:type 2 lanthipeptide synthetase LanM family protein n=1 Tax=Polymorphospora lycopeni TaxID=3140240 RepID=UPI0035D45F45